MLSYAVSKKMLAIIQLITDKKRILKLLIPIPFLEIETRKLDLSSQNIIITLINTCENDYQFYDISEKSWKRIKTKCLLLVNVKSTRNTLAALDTRDYLKSSEYH